MIITSSGNLFSLNYILANTDTTHDCIIKSKSQIYEKVNIYDLTDSSIKVFGKDLRNEILIKDIVSVRFYPRGFWTGAAIGGGIGFVLGFVSLGQGFSVSGDGGSNEFELKNAMPGGLIVAIPFALIGGALGALFADDHTYYLDDLNFDQRKKMLRYLIREYSDR